MKWDVDKALGQLEDLLGGRAPGTGLNRVYVDAKYVYDTKQVRYKNGDGQTVVVWCLSHGMAREAKQFFYGRTIRECYLNARKILIKKRVLTRKKPSEPARKKASPSS